MREVPLRGAMAWLRAALLATFLLLALPAPHAAASADYPVAYDLKDGAGDVVLIATNGSEKAMPDAAGDILRVTTAADGANIVERVTFGAAATDGLVVDFKESAGSPSDAFMLPRTIHWDSENGIDASSSDIAATVTRDDATLVVTFARSALGDSARCFFPTVAVVHKPSADPRISTEEGIQGYQDKFAPRETRCDAHGLMDGLDGTCPAASLPSGVAFAGAATDPAGDVQEYASFTPKPVDRPDLDVLKLEQKLEGNRVVFNLTFSAQPHSRYSEANDMVTVTVGLQPKESEFTPAPLALDISYDPSDFSATGAITNAADPESTQHFLVEGQAYGANVVVSFCASIVPKAAVCAAPEVVASEQRSQDRLVPAPDPCAGKSAPTPTPTGTGTPTPTPATTGGTPTPPTGAPPPATSSGTPASTSGAAATSEKQSPGVGLFALLGGVVVVTLVLRRRG